MPTVADRTPLITYLKVQRDYDRTLRSILRDAEMSIRLELYPLMDAEKLGQKVRREQFLMAQAQINRKLERMWLDVGDAVEAGRAAAAAAAIEDMVPFGWMRAVMPDEDVDYLMRSARLQAARGIELAEARLQLSQIPLSKSVYNNQHLSTGFIDEIVNSALAGGLSAAELARNVSNFINPDVRGGVKYAALRLGRTELNNAFHATQVQAGIKTPWTTAMKWNLSGSHPVPDECNEYAESQHYEGGEAGVFEPSQVPAKPHPNCLCFMTPVTDDREEFLRKLEAGSYDDYLDEEFGLDPSSRFSSAAAAPKPAPTPKPTPTVDPFKDLPRMAEDPNREFIDLVTEVNPGWRRDENFGYNCNQVVDALEMRARGYDVRAARTFDKRGRTQEVIENGWRTPAGDVRKAREFNPNPLGRTTTTTNKWSAAQYREALEEEAALWPDGARGYVTCEWTQGGAHIFSCYKKNGKLYFVDGQPGKLNVDSYFDHMKSAQIMRVDDLIPQPQVLDSLEDATKELKLLDAELELEQAYKIFYQYDELAATTNSQVAYAPAIQQMKEIKKYIVKNGGKAPRRKAKKTGRLALLDS